MVDYPHDRATTADGGDGLLRRENRAPKGAVHRVRLESSDGFEPPITGLQPVALGHLATRTGAEGRNRTAAAVVFSHALYL